MPVMKKVLFSIFGCIVFMLAGENINAQSLKVGVFDIDLMVQAMPGYHIVDSLVQVYERDSLGAEYQIYDMEFHRLDSTYKVDSALYVAGKKTKALFDYTTEERRKMGLNLLYWQQIAQNKSNSKRNQYAQPLYQVVVGAYKKILDKKKYTLILKPQTYEAGFPIDNIFLSVARELKLQGLPQQLLGLGDDPDAVKQPATQPTGNKPKPK
jgi:Skp family chaperone for outer membrane proteins